MTRRAAAIAVLLTCAAVSACGKKGALLPPIVRTPQKTAPVLLSQRSDRILVEWKNPVTSIDGTPLAGVAEVEIWVLELDRATAPAGAMSAKDFEAKARIAAVVKKDAFAALRKEGGAEESGFVYPFSLAGKKPAALRVLFAVRVKDSRARKSELSDPVAFEPQVCPGPPQELALRVLEDGIELAWKAPVASTDGPAPAAVVGYNVYRRGKEGPAKLVNPAIVPELKFEDKDVEYDIPVRYFVRASATGTPPYFESDDSEIREVVPKDIFPPAVPAGVVPVTGRGLISLSWEANREKDLAGYRVRRREEGGTEDVLLTPQLLLENAYTDAAIEKGKRYRYSMSAVDVRGNESARAETVVDVPGDEQR